jgi:hypothetical protein
MPSLNEYWDRFFGSNVTAWRDDVCVFGWEPNPGHVARLRQIAQRYSSRGWRTTYVLAGAGASNSTSLYRPRLTSEIEQVMKRRMLVSQLK